MANIISFRKKFSLAQIIIPNAEKINRTHCCPKYCSPEGSFKDNEIVCSFIAVLMRINLLFSEQAVCRFVYPLTGADGDDLDVFA